MPDHIELGDGIMMTVGDEPLADAIGSLFINFAVFNASLDSALTAILDLSLPQARAVVLPLQPRQKAEMIHWFAKRYWPKETADEIKELYKAAKALADFRNDLAHGHLVRKPDDDHLTIVTYGGPRSFDPKKQKLTTDIASHNALHALRLAEEFRQLAKTVVEHRAKRQGDPSPQEDE